MDENGWLIEQRGNVPCWWDGEGEWTTDSRKALRFARKQDAETYIDEVGWTEAFASEHIWTT